MRFQVLRIRVSLLVFRIRTWWALRAYDAALRSYNRYADERARGGS